MSEFIVVLDVALRNPIIVSISDFRGESRLDVRHHYEGDDGELHPTKKGINMPALYVPALLIALEAAHPPKGDGPARVQVKVDVREPIFVSVDLYRKELRLDVRHFYDDHGDLRPGFKGMNMPWAEREKLLEALRTAIIAQEPEEIV